MLRVDDERRRVVTADRDSGVLARRVRDEMSRREDPSALIFGALDVAGAVEIDPRSAPRVQLGRQFDLAVLTAETWQLISPFEEQLLVHNLVAHLAPGALVVTDEIGFSQPAQDCGLIRLTDGEQSCLAFRRTERTTVHDLIAEARSSLRRLSAGELCCRMHDDPDFVVLDTRTPTDRQRFGVIAGSIHAPRTTLEWMVDPASGYSLDCITSFDQHLVVVCNEGFSSSLSASNLQRLGFAHATDLIGGVMGWAAAGFPLEPPDHTAHGATAMSLIPDRPVPRASGWAVGR